MFCPNYTNKDVFDGFNELIEALGGKPMTAEEFRSRELRNQRTGLDFAAMETAYKVYHLNGGNFLDQTPNGEPSLLFADILSITKNHKQAVAAKAQFYSDKFRKKYGDWINRIFNKKENTPKINAIFDQIEDGKRYSAKDTLVKISEQYPQYKDFCTFLLNSIKGDVQIRVKKGFANRHRGIGGVSFSYNVDSNTNESIIEVFTDSVLMTNRPAETILHEIVHSCTSVYIEKMSEELKLVLDDYVDYVKQNTSDLATEPRGVANRDEFIAEFFSNPEFQKLLKNLPAKGEDKSKSLFEEIVDFILNLFNIDKRNSAYNQIYPTLKEILDASLDKYTIEDAYDHNDEEELEDYLIKYDIYNEPILSLFTNKDKYTPEMQLIKDQAIADGTFMKAPNGNPTHLTEKQWLLVRTKAFKKWFGDWERAFKVKQLEQNKNDILKKYIKHSVSLESVLRYVDSSIIEINEFEEKRELEGTKLKREAISLICDFIRRLPINTSGIKVHYLDKKIREELKSYRQTAAFVNYTSNDIYIIDDGSDYFNKTIGNIEEGIPFFLHELIHHITLKALENENFKQKVLSIYNAVVENLKNKGLWDDYKGLYGFKNLKEFFSESVSNLRFANLLRNTPSIYNKKSIFDDFLSVLKEILAKIFKNSSTELTALDDLYELLNVAKFDRYTTISEDAYSDVSKVVDENGEPLVVYHGSLKKFNIFKGNMFFFSSNREYAFTFGHSIEVDVQKIEDRINILLKRLDNISKLINTSPFSLWGEKHPFDVVPEDIVQQQKIWDENKWVRIKKVRDRTENELRILKGYSYDNEDVVFGRNLFIYKKEEEIYPVFLNIRDDITAEVGKSYKNYYLDDPEEEIYINFTEHFNPDTYTGTPTKENYLALHSDIYFVIDKDLIKDDSGLIGRDTGSDHVGYEYVVFKPNQIKSAINNKGTFDNDNYDMNYSGTEENEEVKEAAKKYGFDVKFQESSTLGSFGDAIGTRLESGQTVSSSEIINRFFSQKYFSEANNTLAQILSRHDVPVRFEDLDGRIMVAKTDKDGGTYIAIDLSNLQGVSNNFLADKFLHEVVHALSVGVINNPTTSEEKALVSLNSSLFDTFSKLFPKEEYSRSTYLYYGLTNEKEFLAEFLSNPDFRAALYAKAAQQDSKSLLTKLKSFINRISRFLLNKNLFGNITKDQLALYEKNLNKYLLNVPTVEKGNIKDENVLKALYDNINTEVAFKDDAAAAEDQILRSIEHWEENNSLVIPFKPKSNVNRPLNGPEIEQRIQKLSENIATALSKRLAAILSSGLPAEEKLKHQQQLLAQITQFKEHSTLFYKNIMTLVVPLSAQLLEDSKRISRIREKQAIMSDAEYIYQSHANFGVYQKILGELKDLLDQQSTIDILLKLIQETPIGETNADRDIKMLKKQIDDALTVANNAIIKTKAILIVNLKQNFADKAELLNFVDLADYIEELEEINYDTNSFFKFVGSVDAAKDPGLRTLHNLVYGAIRKADEQTYNKSVSLLNLQKNLKRGESVLDLYEYNDRGQTTGYLARRYNYGQMYQDYDEFLELLNLECGLDASNRIAPNDDETRKKWNEKRNAWLAKHVQRKYLPKYYEIFSKLSYETQRARSQVQNEIAAIKQKCIGEDGYPHFEKLSERDWNTLQSLYTTKRWLASDYNIDGTKKEGVELKIAKELQELNKALGEGRKISKDEERWRKDREAVIKKAGGRKKYEQQSDDFDWEMLAAWDERNSIKRLKINEETGRSVISEFIDDQFDEEVVYEVFNDQYPNGDSGETYDKLKEEYYKIINTARSSSGEINPFNLSEGAKNKALKLASEMQKIREQAKKNNRAIKKINRQRAKLWRKYTVSEKTELYKKLEAAARERDKSEPGYFDKFRRSTGIYKLDEETGLSIFHPHAWYTKTVAKDEYWDEFMEIIPNESYINTDDDQSGFLNPEFDESQDSAWVPRKDIKRYDNSENYEKIINSPTLRALYTEVKNTLVESNSKMANLRFHDNYLLPQITGSFFKKMKGARAPQNESKWQKIWTYIKYGANALGLDYLGLMEGDETEYGESINDFMSSINIDELGNILTNQSVSISNKVSGVMPDGRQLNIIPQYYTRKLNDPSLISSDLVGILCEYYNNACKFEQKSKIKDECESIVDMMENRTYNINTHWQKPIIRNKDKDGKTESIEIRGILSKQPVKGSQSNTYAIAKKFLEMNLYNIRSTDPLKFGRWNVSKLGQVIRSGIVAVNLGMSPVVAVVGYLTSILGHFVHAITGQKYDPKSAAFASFYVLWHCLKNIGDIGNTTSKDKLMTLAEYFNLSDQGKRKYKHSNRLRGVNIVNNNWCFGFLSMFDYVAKSNVMISTLKTYRLVDNQFTTKEDILRNGWNKPKAEVKKQIEQWKKGRSLFSCLSPDKDGRIVCDKDVDKAYQKVKNVVYARINKTSEAVDGMATETQKAAITTQFLGSAVLMHRQYFPLMLQERFGHTVFDPDQLSYIHGEFRTLGRLIKLFLWDGWRELSLADASKQSVLSGATVGFMAGSLLGPLGSLIGAGAGSLVGALKGSKFNQMFGRSIDYKNLYNETINKYDLQLSNALTDEQRQNLENAKDKEVLKLYNEAQSSITFNYHRRRVITEFLMYKLMVIPIVSLLASIAASCNDDDDDTLLLQMASYIGHRVQWEFFTPYRLDDALNNFKSTSAATGFLDKVQSFTAQLAGTIFPRASLFDTFVPKNQKTGEITRGIYSKYPFAPFSGFDGQWDRLEQSFFKMLPIHNLYEQWYGSKQKDRYYTNQIMHLDD